MFKKYKAQQKWSLQLCTSRNFKYSQKRPSRWKGKCYCHREL